MDSGFLNIQKIFRFLDFADSMVIWKCPNSVVQNCYRHQQYSVSTQLLWAFYVTRSGYLFTLLPGTVLRTRLALCVTYGQHNPCPKNQSSFCTALQLLWESFCTGSKKVLQITIPIIQTTFANAFLVAFTQKGGASETSLKAGLGLYTTCSTIFPPRLAPKSTFIISKCS